MSDILMQSIASVSANVKTKKDTMWGENISRIILKDEYIGGFLGLEDFSHAIIIYHLNEAEFCRDRHLRRHPQNRSDMPCVGIFSQRAKDRPNNIGITSVEIISVTDDTLTVRGLDAIDGTPVLDIKPYYPAYDCKKDARVPQWADRLMEHYF
ncbi:MAG: tRNA (N6-threonylcarbamoyladenosine(37)-N6)-methyltransferase TrmO [Clostridia bacterium]|nr:tRNA (N6-threonylcarbamoyladenosine(37)-N6)-methyltransferase TrmO [Clostridia bacterium]